MFNNFTKEYLKLIHEGVDSDYENYNLINNIISQLNTLNDIAKQLTHERYDEETTKKYQNMSTNIEEMISNLKEYATYFEDNFMEDDIW